MKDNLKGFIPGIENLRIKSQKNRCSVCGRRLILKKDYIIGVCEYCRFKTQKNFIQYGIVRRVI